MNKKWFLGWLAAAGAGMALVGCSHLSGGAEADALPRAEQTLRALKTKFAPDSHLATYNVGIEPTGRGLVLTGEVDRAEARAETVQTLASAGIHAVDRLIVLPAERLGEETWGISCLSIASAREQPEHKAEMGTQILMGDVVRVWKRSTNAIFSWYLCQGRDGYLAWLEQGTFVRCTRQQVEAWTNSPLLIVTILEDRILTRPEANAEAISDVVVADLVQRVGEDGAWYQVRLPDQRTGYLPKTSVEDYAAWKAQRHATAENIERTARLFLGRPYLWGGNSPHGVDCSGLTKLSFCLNGIDLLRNASHQARQGIAIPLDDNLSHLKKGDLLFFGHAARGDRPERVTHVGLYLGDKLFIHSSERVRISSLDPASPIRDEFRIRSLIKARRILPASD